MWWGQISPLIGDAAFPRFAQDAHAAGGAEMLAMNVGAGEFGEQGVARDDDLLAGGGPAGQAEHGAPVAFVHHTFADEIVVLAMVHDRRGRTCAAYSSARRMTS